MTNPLTDIREGEPLSLVAGDTWTWTRSDLATDFPVASWTLAYAFKRRGETTAATVVAASGSGSVYTLTVAAATSAGYAAGTWDWTAYATRTSDSARVTVGSGALLVVANPATSTADTRSHAAKMLAAIEALLEGRSVADVNSYSIKDRSLTKMTPAELVQWRSYYRNEVGREDEAARRASGRASGRTFAARFS